MNEPRYETGRVTSIKTIWAEGAPCVKPLQNLRNACYAFNNAIGRYVQQLGHVIVYMGVCPRTVWVEAYEQTGIALGVTHFVQTNV